MQPNQHHKYKLASVLIDIAIPLTFVMVIAAQHFQIIGLSQELEVLRADIATIRLNSLPTSYGSPNTSSSNTATTTSK